MDYKSLFNSLESALAAIPRRRDVEAALRGVVRELVDRFRDPLGFTDARIYAREKDAYVLRHAHPGPVAEGFRIPVEYEPVREILDRGFVLHEPGDPQVDRELESALGVTTFAAIGIGPTAPFLVSFGLRPGYDREHVIFVLSTIRHLIDLKLRRQLLETRVEEMRAIQGSLLPSRAPEFADYDLWGATLPTEDVGGDLYDFIQVSHRSLAVAIADAAGHGLPAALQARDAIIGLRMGVEDRLRITATIEKLNRVVNRAALASRFISLFYCEIEPNGNLVYCNAGHQPGLLLRMGQVFELRRGGMILGPNPTAEYERGYMLMSPGSVLLLFTDGIVEAESADGEQLGLDGLERLLQERRWTSARELVEAVFEAARSHSGRDTPVDDQTVVAVIRRDSPRAS